MRNHLVTELHGSTYKTALRMQQYSFALYYCWTWYAKTTNSANNGDNNNNNDTNSNYDNSNINFIIFKQFNRYNDASL